MKHTRFFKALDLKITFKYNVQKFIFGNPVYYFYQTKEISINKKIATRERKSEKEEGKCNNKSKN